MTSETTLSTESLLVELFVEELPPRALKKLGEAFCDALAHGLEGHGLLTPESVTTGFASPRRLAAHISKVRAQAAAHSVAHKLMPVTVGLDAAGKPTQALLKKLAAIGADSSVLPQLERRPDGKAQTLFHVEVVRGVTVAEGLQQALLDALARLPIQKVMGYQLADGWTTVQFVRPAHGLVALHGSEVVAVAALGLDAGRQTNGHRFEGSVDPLPLRHADDYARCLLEQGAVIANFAARRAEVGRQLQAAAEREGLAPIDDAALLDEVTALVERPNVLTCRFEPEFLSVPPECLILTMKANQKYFPLMDADGRLTNRFLVVSNITPADPSRVIEGNERVVRPRLADAKFFFDQDRRQTLESRVAGLDRVVYHAQLGSQGERVARVRAIATTIASELGGVTLSAEVDRAARLAKADLLTDMVGEFPELQGVMGGYYALHDGETAAVAAAIEDHYKPRFAGDALPRGEVGLVVAMADKLETLVGMFVIGQLPTGDRDPFALRRHALGLVRMLIERRPPLALDWLLEASATAFASRAIESPDEAITLLKDFIAERLAGYLRELGYSAREVDAVLSLRSARARLHDVEARLAAVRAFAALAEAPALAAVNKRVGNILKKVDSELLAQVALDPSLLREPAEAALHEAMGPVIRRADAAFEAGDFTASLQGLSVLRAPVDAFFETVMVNTDDEALRINRLALLARLHAAMNRVADLSCLSV